MESHVDFGILFDQGLEFLDDGMGILGFYRRLCNLLGDPAFDDSLIARQPTAISMFDNNGHVNLGKPLAVDSTSRGDATDEK